MYEQITQHISKYIQPTAEEIAFFTSLLKFKKIKKNQYLLQQGETARYESYVNKGCLKAAFIDQTGEEYIMQFAIEDWWITDVQSFLNGTPSDLEIITLENSELLQIDYQSLNRLFKKYPKFERFYRILNQKHQISLHQYFIGLHSKTAKERYLHFIKRYPYFIHRIPQYQIASYLGITPEYLSKIRRDLSR